MRLGLQTLKKIPGDETVRETGMKTKVLDLGMENVTWISNDKKRGHPSNSNSNKNREHKWGRNRSLMLAELIVFSWEFRGLKAYTSVYFEESCQCENGRNLYYFTVKFINFLNYTLWLFKLPTSNLQELQELEFQSELGNLHRLAVGCL